MRQLALDAIEATSFFPENGRARLRDMIANRPDWCISRQRSWGVPLPFFLHKDTGELHPDTMAILDRAIEIVAEGGVEAWSRVSGRADPRRRRREAHYTKSSDILEVWFDSARPSSTCCAARTSAGDLGHHDGAAPKPTSTSKATTSTAAGSTRRCCSAARWYGRAPYRGLLTHGFTVDGQGRKMSKSLGNIIEIKAAAKDPGAEIVRLWVASTDYANDPPIDKNILARVVDSYRRIRNTLRFLLANMSDFDPRRTAVPLQSRCWRVDRWALSRAAELQAEILAHYERFEFHPVVAKLQLFCSEDLGAFYLDVLKDRLYTTAPQVARAPRSAQTALWHITHAMLRWMAPFLSFTAEEAWPILAPGKSADRSSPRPSRASTRRIRCCSPSGQRIRTIRDEVNKAIEAVRTAGGVGSSLQANVRVGVQLPRTVRRCSPRSATT